jgi:hypothetical protein
MKYKIESIGEIKAGESKKGEAYKSMDVVLVETTGEYPNSFVASLYKTGDYIKVIDGFSSSYPVGTIVSVELKFKASEYKGKHYQNVSLWSIKKSDSDESSDVKEEIEYPEDDINPDDIPF